MFWFFGAVSYMLFRHREELLPDVELESEPFITIMIPAHNEEVVIKSTLEYLLTKLHYHNYEVLVMDDGSTDRTPEILHQMQKSFPRLRVIRIEENQGKAHAFNIGIFFAKGEYILSNDADTIPEPDALIKYMQYFTSPNGVNYADTSGGDDVRSASNAGKDQDKVGHGGENRGQGPGQDRQQPILDCQHGKVGQQQARQHLPLPLQ